MVVSASNFKANFGRYLNAVSEEGELFITKNGKIIAKLSNPAEDRQTLLDSLVGITAHNPVSLEEARKKRFRRQ